ncbi:MAG: hypothetical protein KKA12_03400 [Alphaproteobacteria bacterium]|nr:hypothetical protein [Alphaproteobacteria bacterium]
MHLGGKPFLRRLTDLVAAATAVMMRRCLAIIRRNLIAIAIDMAEACRDI